jgi:uncharacterized protein (DUF2267 family)
MNHNLFATTIQKTNEWFSLMQENLGWDERKVYDAVKAVLATLRNRLPPVEAAQLGAQLPMLLRGLYYEGYNPNWKPDKEIRTKEDFYQEVQKKSAQLINTKSATKAVLDVLKIKIAQGEVKDITANFPKNLKVLMQD